MQKFFLFFAAALLLYGLVVALRESTPPISWQTTTESRLAGLPRTVTEEVVLSNDSPCTYPMPEVFLRREGGLCPVVFQLRFNGRIIDSKAKLKSTFAPVETELEAMSFVAATENDLAMANGVLVGGTARGDNEFLVKVMRNNTFGCSYHEKSELIFEVARSGDISLLSEKILPGTGQYHGVVCVD
jgi:hypothetical protein